MENVIELDTPIIEKKRVNVPWKAMFLWSIFISGGVTIPHAVNEFNGWYEAKRQEIILAEIEKDLAKEPLTIDLKMNTKALPTTVKREQLLKMLYVSTIQLNQCQHSMTMIKDTVGFMEPTK